MAITAAVVSDAEVPLLNDNVEGAVDFKGSAIKIRPLEIRFFHHRDLDACLYQLLFTLSTHPNAKIPHHLVYLSLYLVAFAQGGHKPCVQAFGADQFDEQDPEECIEKSSFFNWWYFSFCACISVSLLALTYIQDNLSWGLGFGIPCIVMCFSLIVFLLGSFTYRFTKKSDESNPFLRIDRVFYRAATNLQASPSAISMEAEAQGILPCEDFSTV